MCLWKRNLGMCREQELLLRVSVVAEGESQPMARRWGRW